MIYLKTCAVNVMQMVTWMRIIKIFKLIMGRYSKGYYRSLESAGGDESKVHYNYGWYGSVTGTEYDDDGRLIPFT